MQARRVKREAEAAQEEAAAATEKANAKEGKLQDDSAAAAEARAAAEAARDELQVRHCKAECAATCLSSSGSEICAPITRNLGRFPHMAGVSKEPRRFPTALCFHCCLPDVSR